MENVWFLAAVWVGLALIATLLAIWLKVSFLPASPLRRFRLVAFGESSIALPMCQRPLQIEERIAAYVLSIWIASGLANCSFIEE